MLDHVIRSRYQDTDNDEVRCGNDTKRHDSVPAFRLDEDETGEPDGPDDEKTDRGAEETLALTVIARQPRDEEAHHEQADQ